MGALDAAMDAKLKAAADAANWKSLVKMQILQLSCSKLLHQHWVFC
jgi:hypothetical protein